MTEKLPRKYERLPAVSTMIAHLQAGLAVKDIAALYGVAETSVRSFCSRNGLSLVDLRNWKKTRADVVALKQSQMIEAITPEGHASGGWWRDPKENSFLRIEAGRVHFPGGLGCRVDSALYAGYRIPPYYDSLIGKLIVHARTRNECLMRLKRALGGDD